MTDRRLTPSNGRVAHVSLRGQVQADRYVEGEPASIAVPLTDLAPSPGGRRDRQLLLGDRVTVLDRQDGAAFVQSQKDGYCGYVDAAALGPALQVTHRVAVRATHLYPAADIKLREQARISLGAGLAIRPGGSGRFRETLDGLFVPAAHVRAIDDRPDDPVGVAESLLGTPYLWGGNSSDGLDCSGLVQAALLACGIPCPGDSDLQEAALGRPLASGEEYRRGDLLFWKGHVALAVGDGRIIHANAYTMSVSYEDAEAAIARIDTAGEGPLRAVKRLQA